jgi:protein-S-isoprenylcysteine O-methyltransferase Ste14
MRKLLMLIYSVLVYVFSLASLVYAVGWLGDVPLLPTTIDGQPGHPPLRALLVDVGLVAIFAVQHSVMARPGFKRLWTRIVPTAAERSTYVLLTAMCLFAICLFWRSLPGVVWCLEGAAAAVAWALFALGWIVALASTFMLSHVELFGLAQARNAFRGKPPEPSEFRERWLYRIVRHPLMLGFLIAFWAAPTMSASRLTFALVTTGYILVALQLEERDLRRSIGARYSDYQARVPMLLPRLFTRHAKG